MNQLSQVEKWRFASLIAPAGYGKTVLMMQLAGTIQQPLSWYQLDEYDNDPAVFLQYFIAAIRQNLPGYGKEALNISAQPGLAGRLRLITTILLNELGARADRGLMIFLDDYHVIREPFIHDFIREFLTHMPEKIRLVIASRTALPFALPRFDLNDASLVFQADKLRFTHEEIALFLVQKQAQVPETVVSELEARTAGWPAALRLLRNVSFTDTALEIPADQTIYDYLASEVFMRQPPEIRDFLTNTAVLEVMTAENCNRLLNIEDAARIFDYLEERQLFLTRLPGAVPVYRYHDLFRDFLAKQFNPNRRALLQKAALLAREAGEFEQAINHYLEAGDTENALLLIKETGRRAFQQGRWQTVARWLTRLAGDLAADPWLAMFQAQIESYRGRIDEAENWTNIAINGFNAHPDQTGLTESWILQAKILRRRGHYLQSLELLDRAASHLASGERDRIDLLLEKAYALALSGQVNQAASLLENAFLRLEGKADGYTVAFLSEALGNFYYMLGEGAKAIQLFQKGAKISPDHQLPSYYMFDSLPYVYKDWGEIELALDYINRNIRIKEKYGLIESMASAYAVLSYIQLELGRYHLAEEYDNKSLTILLENGPEIYFLLLLQSSQASDIFMQGRRIEALTKIRSTLKTAREYGGMVLALNQCIGGIILTLGGELEEAKTVLLESLTVLKHNYKARYCDACKALAWIYFLQGETSLFEQYSREFLEVAAKINYLLSFLPMTREMLQPILRYALENGVEVTFSQRILVKLGDFCLPLLTGLAADPDPELRRRTILPLLEIGGEKADRLLTILRDDPDPQIRRQAGLLIKQPPDVSSFQVKEARLRLNLLGNFQLLNDNTEFLGWRTHKTRDLLAYLAHLTEPVGKNQILDDLWPDLEPEKATGLFRTTLYYLRSVLMNFGCASPIRYQGKQFRLSLEQFSSDRQCFEDLLSVAGQPEVALETTLKLLESAVALYRGDYLADLDYEWVLPCQLRLRRLYLEARLKLARGYLNLKDTVSALKHLLALEELEPLDEEIHRLLFTVYAATGNRAKIKEQYLKLARLYQEELGLEPALQTKELYLSLYNQ